MSQQKSVSVYVAGGWKYRHDVKKVMDQLRSEGFNVVSGWIERENGDYRPEALRRDAEYDIDEVLSSDYLFAVMDNDTYAYRGTFTEIGCALGAKKPVIIYCPGTHTVGEDGESCEYTHYCQSNVFFHHGLCTQVRTVKEGIEIMRGGTENS